MKSVRKYERFRIHRQFKILLVGIIGFGIAGVEYLLYQKSIVNLLTLGILLPVTCVGTFMVMSLLGK